MASDERRQEDVHSSDVDALIAESGEVAQQLVEAADPMSVYRKGISLLTLGMRNVGRSSDVGAIATPLTDLGVADRCYRCPLGEPRPNGSGRNDEASGIRVVVSSSRPRSSAEILRPVDVPRVRLPTADRIKLICREPYGTYIAISTIHRLS